MKTKTSKINFCYNYIQKAKKLFTKKIKNSERGITFSDKNLWESGQHFNYIIDNEASQIIITKSDAPGKQNKGTVSRKKSSTNYIPLIDIRSQKAKIFKDSTYLSVEVYEDKIIISNFDDTNESTNERIELSTDNTDIQEILYSTEKHSQTENNLTNQTNSIPLTLTEFFCGAGLFGKGFEDAGFTIVDATDIENSAITTYNANHAQAARNKSIVDYNKEEHAESVVMLGGPPCQGFSNANRMSNFLDNPNNSLVLEYIHAIQNNKKCKLFIIENVPQLLTAGDGKFLNEIKNQLNDFSITYGVLDSKDYGSAQSRKRTIIIGSKIGAIPLPKATHGASPLQPYKTVGDAFFGLNDSIPNQRDVTKPRPDTELKMSFVPQGGNWENIPEEYRNAKMQVGKTQSNVYRRLDLNKPSITIANPRKSNLIHPTENRGLSIRECARLFDLPDSFIFKGKLSEMQQQVANGVPYTLGLAIAKQIITYWNKAKDEVVKEIQRFTEPQQLTLF